MCKTGHDHAANGKTHKPRRVHTRHDNIKTRSQWKTWTACYNTKHTWTEERATERTRDHTLTQRDRTWSVSVWTPTRDRNSRHECQDPFTALQHETKHAEERAHGSSALAWNQDMTGVSGLCHKAMNNTRPKWQDPDTFQIFWNLPGIFGKFPEVSHPFATLLENEKNCMFLRNKLLWCFYQLFGLILTAPIHCRASIAEQVM